MFFQLTNQLHKLNRAKETNNQELNREQVEAIKDENLPEEGVELENTTGTNKLQRRTHKHIRLMMEKKNK